MGTSTEGRRVERGQVRLGKKEEAGMVSVEDEKWCMMRASVGEVMVARRVDLREMYGMFEMESSWRVVVQGRYRDGRSQRRGGDARRSASC